MALSRIAKPWIILPAIPIVAVTLWLFSGREVLTKPVKMVDVTVADKLFGGSNIETHAVHGRVLGYFVGLDIVLAATLLSGFCGFLWWRNGQRARASDSGARER